MKALIVPGDLEHAATTMARLPPNSNIVILSGFPCCVNHSPPTETDGPPGAMSIAQCAMALGYNVILVTDECNEVVFRAAAASFPQIQWEIFPSDENMSKEDERRMEELVSDRCDLIVSCERAGPAKDGRCYTMRGIDMNAKGLIAPLHRIVEMVREKGDNVKFIAIGDGGNELGMGKVIDKIRNSPKINNGDKIGAVTVSDYLIAASVSNWGGYAFSAACAIVKSNDTSGGNDGQNVNEWVDKCVPTEEQETRLLERCVQAGCRDGVSGEMEATVDGMPFQTSADCLNSIRVTAAHFSL